MDVILLEKMRNLGALGDKVKVKSGYARNFLIPKGKAVYATKVNLEKFEARRAELEKTAAARLKAATERQQAIQSVGTITMSAKAGDEGKLFGSVGTRDITEALKKAGIEVEKREVRLPEGTIRMLGEYEIAVDLESDVTATVKINIVGEG